METEKNNENIENLVVMNGDAPAPPAASAAAAAARQVRQYMQVG